MHPCPTPHTGGIDQGVVGAITLEGHEDAVAGGAGDVGGHHALVAQDAVDQGGLADVGAPDNRHADARPVVQGRLLRGLVEPVAGRLFTGLAAAGVQRRAARRRHVLAHALHQALHATPVGGRDGRDRAQAQRVEFGTDGVGIQAVGLVHHHAGLHARRAQLIGDRLVLRRQTIAGVHQEQHVIGLGHRAPGLLGHRAVHLRALARQAAGVHHQVGEVPHLANAVLAIPREPRDIGHQGITRARELIEQGGLADVGPPNQRDHRDHRRSRPPRYPRPPGRSELTRRPESRGSPRSAARCRSPHTASR